MKSILNDDLCSAISKPIQKSEKGWANYLLGVYAELQKDGLQPEAVNCVFSSDIPIGAGMSSSAALESGFELQKFFRMRFR